MESISALIQAVCRKRSVKSYMSAKAHHFLCSVHTTTGFPFTGLVHSLICPSAPTNPLGVARIEYPFRGFPQPLRTIPIQSSVSRSAKSGPPLIPESPSTGFSFVKYITLPLSEKTPSNHSNLPDSETVHPR